MLSAINPITYVESLKFLNTSEFLLQLAQSYLKILKNAQFTYSTSLRMQLLVTIFGFAKLVAQQLNLAHYTGTIVTAWRKNRFVLWVIRAHIKVHKEGN